ncbi:MAG: ABC transporter permease [Acidobacteriaceae bacterium]|nr:ABC transporter permease [Acidobacteriaceae bacterium]
MSWWRRKKHDEDLDRELRSDLELEAEEQQERGLSPEEAQYAARRAFGNTTFVKEEVRETWGWMSLERLWQDLRYSIRTLRKSPAFTMIAVGTLALAIGANTAIFSIIESVMLRPLPYKDPGRLALLANGTTYTDFKIWKLQNRSFEDMAAYYRLGGRSRVTLIGPSDPESIQGAFVSANFFPLLGVQPLIGRWLTPDEEARHERVIVLSYGLWNRWFGGSPDALGKVLRMDGVGSLVVGVMPLTFQFPAKEVQFWAPITTNRYWGEVIPFDPNYSRYAYARWEVIARLKSGVTVNQAQAEMTMINTRLEQTAPDRYRATDVHVAPLRANLSGNTRLALYVLFGTVFFVLLIACSNVANLVLARGSARGREMAVRSALGAGRARLVRQVFTEGLVLAVLAACAGIVLAIFGIRAIVAFGPPEIPRLDEATIDPGVLGFALAISMLSAIVFGLFPAFKTSQCNPQDSLKSGGRGISGAANLTHTRSLLVVVEFALAVVLLTGAGLLVRSFLAVEALDPGFRPEQVLTMRITLPAGTTAAERSSLDELTIERVRSVPGVESVGAIDNLFSRQPEDFGLRAVEGQSSELRTRWAPLDWVTIREDFFQTMGARLLRGRFFSNADDLNSPLVAIIDETMARRYWPGENPIGKRFKGFDARGRNDEWLTVIGVVPDMRRHGLERQPAAHVYQWHKQARSIATPDLVVRTAKDPKALAPTLRNVIRSLNGSAILSAVTTVEQGLSDQLSPRRFQTSLVGLFASIALVLASVGLYGVMHYSVVQRTHEIGVRMALGAQPSDVLFMVIGRGILLGAAGLALGLPGAWWLTKLISGLLYSVKPSDPGTFVAVSSLLMIVAALASAIPAWRAIKLDPLSALRFE